MVKWRTSTVAPGRLAALAGVLNPGETVQWAGGPDLFAALQSTRWLWWVGIPWTAIALTIWFSGFIADGWQMFVIAPGLALTAAPVVIMFFAKGTTYAITNRRVIIKHDTVSKQRLVTVDFEDMDDKLEILPVSPGIGHLYFASGLPTKWNDVDYTGKLAFRHLAAPEAVAERLERARALTRAQKP
jgi:hypothetical protein